MNVTALKNIFGWGFLLWFVGYVLGFVLFAFVPASIIGWVIMPIGILITLWLLLKKIKDGSFQYYVSIAVAWTAIAIIFDYLFLVLLLKPTDGYYKIDVYLYYGLTFVLPITIGWYKTRTQKAPGSKM